MSGSITYPAQCSCGHLYLEKYQWQTPLPDGRVGFCWCGFCRTRLNIYKDNSFRTDAAIAAAPSQEEKK